MCFNVKIFMKMLKILALTANLGHISRVQKPGLRPTALAFLYPRLGQKPAQAKGWARLGPAFFGLAWPGFWPQAGAGTSLCCATGDGNVVYHLEDGEVMQCDECGEWSHVACQQDGRASDLPKNKPFFCDTCDPSIIKEMLSGASNRSSSKR